ncbi:Dipeptide transport ATP-binding protein dppF [Vibrio nigripulchritudo MADA3029]|uniref:Dipeptide transport ATP-binding protein dppF n=2 Tax=Vibrio nigripulchritudo TaxID=28173 RepID=U4KD58_9VIBR|nr:MULTISPECIES: ATP-binding cassette domain-containing protein [Vibrio]UAB72342.1 ABC transporter ATP-binding protein [Vibrio sp. SCSIO 43132]CCN32905.1 Dipeptide transport ATP-binding protein dppF [Vibrio nigripulchritudo AM115]CCN40408.1 Dipeptide transport ATP-binding protein dppF [Vibrio nigripulchritudo FTn2]CCN50083.1 Dipeptide transport ATP-binding protein dppF [Vibrio nigripulchritudo MADA3020]CCN54360.1 Dipeptide transport ATP-binding protein dppF [Vibrio nigripulchritudo MADA3021]
MALLEVKNLQKRYVLEAGSMFGREPQYLHVTKNVSLKLEPGKTLAVVGESGSGKSTLGRMVSMLDVPDSGDIYLAGQEISRLSSRAQRPLRQRIGLVFQDPYSALNPRMPILDSLIEPMKVNGIGNKEKQRARALEVLEWVGMREDVLTRYPHEFSGGQRQRIAIARALMLKPELIIADEPLSALDVSVQSQILNLFKDLQEEHGIAFFFISHDMAVVYHLAHEVVVMKSGEIVEQATKEEFFESPKHPYSQELLNAVPDIGNTRRRNQPDRKSA